MLLLGLAARNDGLEEPISLIVQNQRHHVWVVVEANDDPVLTGARRIRLWPDKPTGFDLGSDLPETYVSRFAQERVLFSVPA